eukprot:228388-Chlamydomonas_euryale.AAC.5
MDSHHRQAAAQRLLCHRRQQGRRRRLARLHEHPATACRAQIAPHPEPERHAPHRVQRRPHPLRNGAQRHRNRRRGRRKRAGLAHVRTAAAATARGVAAGRGANSGHRRRGGAQWGVEQRLQRRRPAAVAAPRPHGHV